MTQKRLPLAALRLALLLSAALTASSSRAEFGISEILADNSGTTLSDEDGFPADWIEIQNPDPAGASINGYYLTDDPNVLNKWMLPDVTIGANGYLLVFATGKDRALAGSELHTNFALGAGGDVRTAASAARWTACRRPALRSQRRRCGWNTASRSPRRNRRSHWRPLARGARPPPHESSPSWSRPLGG